MSLTKATNSMIKGAPVSVLDFGAVGDWDTATQTGTDDTAAIQTFINYCRDAGVKGVFPEDDRKFRVTSTLVTQYDGAWAGTNLDFNNALIVADFSGSPLILVTGGAATQTLLNLNLGASNAHKMNATYSNRDALSHGIVVTNSIVHLTGLVLGFAGHGYVHNTTASNSNTCQWDLVLGGCHFGFYGIGDGTLNDNFAVCSGRFQVYGNAGYGFFGESNCIIRSWDAWIYSEENCLHADYSAVASVNLLRASTSNFWIYAEQANSAKEVSLGANCNTNTITSVRKNKDSDAGTNNIWWSGNKAHSPNAGTRTATPLVAHNEYARVNNSAEWVDVEVLGTASFGSVRGFGNTSGDPYIGLVNDDRTKWLRLNGSIIENNVGFANPKVTSQPSQLIADYQSNSTVFFTANIATTETFLVLPTSTASYSAIVTATCWASGATGWSFVYLIHTNVVTGLVATLLTADGSNGSTSLTFSKSGANLQVSVAYSGAYGAGLTTTLSTLSTTASVY